MNRTNHYLRARLTFGIIALIALCPGINYAETFSVSGGGEWRPVPQEHLDMKEPQVDPDAGIEYLYFEEEYDDIGDRTTRHSTYVRMKAFTEQGAKQLTSIQTFYYSSGANSHYAQFADRFRFFHVRIIKPDGSIVPLENGEVVDKDVVTSTYRSRREQTFYLPPIEPGSIVEYQTRIDRTTFVPGFSLSLAREYPIQQLRFRVRPYQQLQYQLTWDNIPNGAVFERVEGRFSQIDVVNIDALDDAPFLPPIYEYSPWISLVYTSDIKLSDPDSYWKMIAQDLFDRGRSMITPKNGAIRDATATAIGDATDPEEKLRRIYDYVQSKVANLNFTSSGKTEEEVRDILSDRRRLPSPASTLDDGYGTAEDVNHVFASMAASAGFDLRLARISDRSLRFFNRMDRIYGLFSGHVVAIEEDEGWRFCDPGNLYLSEPCSLEWPQTGTAAILAHGREVNFATTQTAAHRANRTERRGDLKLHEDGMLTGEIRIIHFGQDAIQLRKDIKDKGTDDIERSFRDQLHERLPQAEILGFELENLYDSKNPPTIKFNIMVPGYAEALSSRLFLTPSFFARNAAPLFTDEHREHDLYFRFQRGEFDFVRIVLPEGYSLEEASSPTTAGSNEAFNHDIQISTLPDGSLLLRRVLEIKAPLLSVQAYPAVKAFFELVARQDNHLLTLRRIENPAAPEGQQTNE